MVGRPSRMVGWPCRMSGSSREALLNFWVWLGGPPGCPGVVTKPSRMSKSDRKALPNIRELPGFPLGWLRGPPGCP